MRGLIVRKDYTERKYPIRTTKELLESSMVVINKPKGPFSFEVTDEVKDILKVKKTGHAGTLDPNATGVLTIGINKGCHVLQAIGHAPKEYEGIMHLHSEATLSKIISASKKFQGVITQLPPVRSAVKRAERQREIYSLEVEDVRGRDVYFTVKCQAGTYVRKLCTEWGKELAINAHLKELIRTAAGPYTLHDAVKLEIFSKKPESYLKPVETAVTHLKHVWIDDKTVTSMKNGSQPFLPGVYKYEEGISVGDLIAIMTPSQELAAIGTSLLDENGFKGVKGQIAKLERVML
ncbi:MAG TPA: RNA-guided pseudouridylation complex pseudouridine synthase subunit Cbf5 [Candidatus Nanoarchaeia archaeon]|nr:RNA-guided pseudouridylation complex pseudouridine synthase subunit Cbf5 [Candidatus Nanoarchaeia archaeon]